MSRVQRPDTAFAGPTVATDPDKCPAYLAWLHDLPSVVSEGSPVQAHHVRLRRAPDGDLASIGQLGKRVSDFQCVPLTAQEHEELHRGNEADWWRRIGLDPLLMAGVLAGYWQSGGRDPAMARRLARIVGGE